jgi:uncharacterized protein (TIGR03086 family)
MSTAPYEQAIVSAKKVLAGVKPEHLTAETPCATWKVSDLVNHIVGGQHFFGTMAKGEAMSDAAAPDFSAGDFNAAFAKGAADSVAAFKAPGTMEKTLQLPWGPMPGSAFVGLAAIDTFTHAWDLARATGQNSDLDPDLAAGLLMGARAGISAQFRGADGVAPFGPELKAPAGASKADELAAFLGRKV